MSLSRHQIVDALFEEAMDLPPGAQAEVLETRCGADRALRDEVAELLRLARTPAPDLPLDAPSEAFRQAALQDAVRLLGAGRRWPGRRRPRHDGPDDHRHARQESSVSDADAPAIGPVAGERLGRWRVLREIGRGGMGAVYLVERVGVEFRQQGALKLVECAGRPEDVFRRFRRERRILASLSHPHIAQLLDGGRTADGRPYLVMEHVDGRPIDRYCDEAQLTIDERLDLFARVCSALQQAHRQLVVHRDVKPSNILVTADGHPMLLDFGIARLLSPTQEEDGDTTAPAARILTPDYASPEQVRGDPVAIASDVYQLGLLLYELMTGARAQSIAAAGPHALEQHVCEAEPVHPSVRARTAPDDVCRARRTTPSALARALRGDLDTVILCALRKEPERRYGSVGQLLDDIERYRHGAPLRARADSPVYRARKFMARHRAGVAWASAALIAAIALLVVAGGARVRALREAAEARQMETLLAQLFALPNRALTGRPPVALDYVRQAVELTRRQLAEQPTSQARLLSLLGGSATNLGNYELAKELLSQALALRVAATGADSVETASALNALARSEHYLGHYEEAEISVRRALAIRRQRLGDRHVMTIDTTRDLGDLLHTQGKLVEAEQVLRGTVAALRGRPELRDTLGRTLRDLGNVLRDRGALIESATSFREALSILTELHGEGHVVVAETNAYFGRLLVRLGQFDEADARLTHSLGSLRHSFGGDHPLSATALRELGLLRTEQGRFDEAERALADAQTVVRAWLGDEHPIVPRNRAHQAELARRRGDAPDAIRIAQLALDQFQRMHLNDHPSAIDARLTLGRALLAVGRTADAKRELTAGLTRAQPLLNAGDPRLAQYERALAAYRDPVP